MFPKSFVPTPQAIRIADALAGQTMQNFSASGVTRDDVQDDVERAMRREDVLIKTLQEKWNELDLDFRDQIRRELAGPARAYPGLSDIVEG